jgi:hypothetical protein
MASDLVLAWWRSQGGSSGARKFCFTNDQKEKIKDGVLSGKPYSWLMSEYKLSRSTALRYVTLIRKHRKF